MKKDVFSLKSVGIPYNPMFTDAGFITSPIAYDHMEEFLTASISGIQKVLKEKDFQLTVKISLVFNGENESDFLFDEKTALMKKLSKISVKFHFFDTYKKIYCGTASDEERRTRIDFFYSSIHKCISDAIYLAFKESYGE